MSEFSISSSNFKEGEEIPQKFGYKHGNEQPSITIGPISENYQAIALIMDDPDAMGAVGKVWVHWLQYYNTHSSLVEKWKLTDQGVGIQVEGKTDFGEIGYGGPAPPDKRHTYVFKAYALDTNLNLNPGYSKQELEDAIKGHILAEAKLTGTFAP